MSGEKTTVKDKMLHTQSRLLVHRIEDGRARVEICLQDETVWMTQVTMVELYQTTPQKITLHLNAINQESEVDLQATCKEPLQVQSEGSRKVSRNRKIYNLPAIVTAEYRGLSPDAALIGDKP